MTRATLISFLAIAFVGCAVDSPDDLDSGEANDIDWSEVEECFNFDVECDGELVCKPIDRNETRHACLSAEPEGFCDDDSDCGDNGFCVGEVSHLAIFSWDGGEAGKCHSISDEGEPCYNFNFECSGDLVCSPGQGDEEYQTCVTPAGDGGLCDDPDDCDQEAGYFCAKEGIEAGQCVLVKNADDPCLFDWTCSSGLSCIPRQNIDLSFCNEPGEKGSYCDSDTDCRLPMTCEPNWNLQRKACE